MLHGVDALEQRGLGVVLEDRDGLLRHDRAAIQGRVDEVDGHARDRDPGRERVPGGVEPGERRQQRRVDVEDAAGEGVEHGRAHEPQVPGEDDDVRRHGAQRVREHRVVAARHEDRLDPLLRGPPERRALAVGEHEDDLAAELAAGRRRDQRPQVRPRPRHPDRDPTAHLARASSA